MKICRSCNKKLSEKYFSENIKLYGGYEPWCESCMEKGIKKAYRRSHKGGYRQEYQKLYQKEYRNRKGGRDRKVKGYRDMSKLPGVIGLRKLRAMTVGVRGLDELYLFNIIKGPDRQIFFEEIEVRDGVCLNCGLGIDKIICMVPLELYPEYMFVRGAHAGLCNACIKEWRGNLDFETDEILASVIDTLTWRDIVASIQKIFEIMGQEI